MKQATLEERSAGGVVFRRISESANQSISYEFLIGKHSGYHKWVFPKGHVEEGESTMEAATREVAEELGVEARITEMSPLKTISYFYFADPDESGKTTRRVAKYQEQGGKKVRVHKTVTFYLMEIEKELGKEGWEMEARKWVSYEEGMKLLAFEGEREVFEVAGKTLLCL